MTINLYQTLRDRNPNQIEKDGPFKCKHENAWLGPGYYFWDSHVELAHWWGYIAHKKFKFDYIICASNATFDDKCWDLHGNGLHRKQFIEICERIVKEGLSNKSDLLVFQVIEWAKKKNILMKFGYEAIRAMGNDTIPSHEINVKRMKFDSKKNQYLDLYPPIQVCLIEKNALNLHNYRIISPLRYINKQML